MSADLQRLRVLATEAASFPEAIEPTKFRRTVARDHVNTRINLAAEHVCNVCARTTSQHELNTFICQKNKHNVILLQTCFQLASTTNDIARKKMNIRHLILQVSNGQLYNPMVFSSLLIVLTKPKMHKIQGGKTTDGYCISQMKMLLKSGMAMRDKSIRLHWFSLQSVARRP